MMARKLQFKPFTSASDPILDPNNPNLLWFYDMGDTVSGPTMTDLSPASNDGTIVGATVVGGGKFGNATRFAGGSDRVTSVIGSTPTNRTFCGWFNVTTLSVNQSLVMFGETSAGSSSPDRIFMTAGNVIFITLRDGGSGFDSASWTYGSGTYVFVVGIWRSSGTCELFVDDMVTPIASFTGSAALQTGGDSAIGVYYNGDVNSGFNNALQGDADHCRNYDIAVTEAERVALKAEVV